MKNPGKFDPSKPKTYKTKLQKQILRLLRKGKDIEADKIARRTGRRLTQKEIAFVQMVLSKSENPAERHIARSLPVTTFSEEESPLRGQ